MTEDSKANGKIKGAWVFVGLTFFMLLFGEKLLPDQMLIRIGLTFLCAVTAVVMAAMGAAEKKRAEKD